MGRVARVGRKHGHDTDVQRLWLDSLEAVDLDVLLLDNALLRKKLADARAVVALELDDLAPLDVVDDRAIAAKVLSYGDTR